MAQRGAEFERILEKYCPGASVRKGDRFASGLSNNGRRGLNAKDAEDSAEGAEESLCVPLRTPSRPLRLNASSNKPMTPSWNADLLVRPQVLIPLVAECPQPRSGEMFIAREPGRKAKLRRSAMFFTIPRNRPTHYAPGELANSPQTAGYEYFVPTGLKTNPRFLTISSEHFRVTYPADVDRRDANQVLSTLDSARADFLRRANLASISGSELGSMEIRFNDSTGDFTARTGQPWWAAAATKGNRIEFQPVALLKRRGILVTTLRHELAHLVIARVSANRAPRWLGEGFAIYPGGEGRMRTRYQAKRTLS